MIPSLGKFWPIFALSFLLEIFLITGYPTVTKKPFNLEELLAFKFTSKEFDSKWISGTEFLKSDSSKGIFKMNLETNLTENILSQVIVNLYNVSRYAISPDHRALLLECNVQSGYRRSIIAQYFIYSLLDKSIKPLARGKQLSLATWAGGFLGDGIVFVYNNDIYYRYSARLISEVQITFSGLPGIIFNGIPDLVYKDDVLGSSPALWISPDRTKICFAQYNDTMVPETMYMRYGTAVNQYPSTVKIRYSKAGVANPIITLFWVKLPKFENSLPPELNQLDLPNNLSEPILASVCWINNEILAFWMNRVQTKGQILSYDTKRKYKEPEIWTEMSEEHGWLEPNILLTEEANLNRIITIAPFDNYLRVMAIERGATWPGKPLSKGNIEAYDLYGIDIVNDIIYFSGSGENDPTQVHIYGAALNKDEYFCASCNVGTFDGYPCTYASVLFSLDMSNAALTCLGPNVPYTAFYSTNSWTVFKPYWEENLELKQLISTRILPEIIDFNKIPLGSNISEELFGRARIYMPPHIPKNQKIPLLIYVYAGPGSALVLNVFPTVFDLSTTFGLYLSTNRSIAYVFIDARGSSGDGQKLKHQVFRQLGNLEIRDQATVVKYLLQKCPQLDRTRIGIWGWSYGGYATASALSIDEEHLFKCGISVAPVTNWIFYDSIYTERYMGLPTEEDNQAGYLASDLTQRVDLFRNHSFLLIHGNADDNVHYQQSMALARALQLKDILFQQQSYPEENHNLDGVKNHVFHTMDRFWSQCFNLHEDN